MYADYTFIQFCHSIAQMYGDCTFMQLCYSIAQRYGDCTFMQLWHSTTRRKSSHHFRFFPLLLMLFFPLCKSLTSQPTKIAYTWEYSLFFFFFLPRRILAICRLLRLIWLLSTRPPVISLFSCVLTFCLCISYYAYNFGISVLTVMDSVVTIMSTGHYPVLPGAVDMTGMYTAMRRGINH